MNRPRGAGRRVLRISAAAILLLTPGIATDLNDALRECRDRAAALEREVGRLERDLLPLETRSRP